MSESSSSEGDDSWIQWFCGLQGHEMFCEVERGYIEDGFNLYGLRHWVPSINDSLDVILDRVGHSEASSQLMEATYALYGLIHARYVLTTSGLEAMYAKYTLQEFGNCPHFLCRGQPVVPLGVRDEPHMETVKLYCPKCQDIYVHPSLAAQTVDGAYFGTTFPHLFFMTYGSMIPDPPKQKFVPRVFGFRVHASAANGAFARGQQANQEQQQQYQRELEARRRARAASAGALVPANTAPEGAAGTVSRIGCGIVRETARSGGFGAAATAGLSVEGETRSSLTVAIMPRLCVKVEVQSQGQAGARERQAAETPPTATAVAERDGEEVQRRGEEDDGERERASGRGEGEGGDTRDDENGSRSRSRGRRAVAGGAAGGVGGTSRGGGGCVTAIENGHLSRRDGECENGGIVDQNHQINGENGEETVARCSGQAQKNSGTTVGPDDNHRDTGRGAINRNGTVGEGADGANAGNGGITPPPSVGKPTSQERGLKRSPSKELECPDLAEEAEGGGSTRGEGGGGRNRAGKGKVPRSRSGSSGRGTTTAAAALTAEGGTDSRRTSGGPLA